jgi:uncharacterized repeat protein (TIGR03803 family)
MRKEKSRFIASVAVSLIAAALVIAPGAWAASTYKILHAFRKSSGGQGPVGNLVSDAAGNLYGTTYGGGLLCSCGVVFKLAHNSDGSWTEHVLHRFTGGADGNSPTSELILDAAGNLYGTTNYGGLFGRGVVFKLAPNPGGTWTEQVLYSFMGGTDGSIGSAGMIFDAAGNLYGTNYYGGSSSCDCGVIFKLAPNPDGTWTEHVLYRFAGGMTDGANPRAGVILDAAGNLYGTTEFGGLGWSGGSGGWGTVFELMPNPDGTWTEHVLYRFTGGIDGATPFAGGVISDAAGNLYGTTRGGGSGGSGAVFELTPSSGGWNESVLHSFTGGADGSGAAGWLVLDAAGNLYGTAVGGGVGYGVVFELTRRASGGWRERVLHAFLGYGASPIAGLIRGASGNLYGTAPGGTSHGLVWEIKP